MNNYLKKLNIELIILIFFIILVAYSFFNTEHFKKVTKKVNKKVTKKVNKKNNLLQNDLGFNVHGKRRKRYVQRKRVFTDPVNKSQENELKINASNLAASQTAAENQMSSQLKALDLAVAKLTGSQQRASTIAASQLTGSQKAASQQIASQLMAYNISASQIAASQLTGS